MTCSKTQKHLRAYLDGELGVVLRSTVSAHLRECAECSMAAAGEREFDLRLREIDDFYGEAQGLAVPPNFLPRVIDLARKQPQKRIFPMVTETERKPFWNWFFDFGLPVRLAVASLLLLATIGGLRAGQVITDLITRSTDLNQPVILPDMTPAEQSLVILMRSEGFIASGQLSPLNKADKAQAASEVQQ